MEEYTVFMDLRLSTLKTSILSILIYIVFNEIPVNFPVGQEKWKTSNQLGENISKGLLRLQLNY